MANFRYDVTYGGEEATPSLFKDVLDAVEGVKTVGMKISYHDGSQFLTSYKVTFDDKQVAFLGVRKGPAKVAGTERVNLEFAGTVDNIDRARSTLLEKIDSLELS